MFQAAEVWISSTQTFWLAGVWILSTQTFAVLGLRKELRHKLWGQRWGEVSIFEVGKYVHMVKQFFSIFKMFSVLRALGAMLRKFIGDHRHEKIEFQSAVFSSAISVQVPHTNYSVFWDRRTNVFILLLRKRFNTSLRSNENRKTISWRTFSKNIQHSIETRKILTKP